MKGWATYKPYVQLHYMIGHQRDDTFKDISFSGLLSARVNSSIGPIAAHFPNIKDSKPPLGRKIAEPKMSIPDGNIVYSSDPGTTGQIALACYIDFGLDLEFSVTEGLEDHHFNGPDVSSDLRPLGSCESSYSTDYCRSVFGSTIASFLIMMPRRVKAHVSIITLCELI